MSMFFLRNIQNILKNPFFCRIIFVYLQPILEREMNKAKNIDSICH